MSFDFQLFVIGAGSGGVRAARMAAARGVSVAIAEARYLGGTCVNVGCVPKKLFAYAGLYGHHFEEARRFGWQSSSATFDWPTLRDNCLAEVTRLNGIYEGILDRAEVTRLWGHATIKGPHTVEMEGKIYTAQRILIATGGWPHVPDLEGRQHVITSNELFSLPELPDRLVIVGAGYIACEFASIFKGLGVDVHLLYRGELLLRGFDEDVRHHVLQEMQKKGVQWRPLTKLQRIDEQADGSLKCSLDNAEPIIADQVLYATGRRPNVTGLGLENVQVQTNKGALVVDEHFQTSEPSIYALGDVIDRVQLTPVALAEAMVLVDHLYGGERVMDYALIPTAVFTDPSIAVVGLTEQQAKEQANKLQIFRSEFRPLKHTVSGSSERTFMKLIVDGETDRVLGVHMVGPGAGEIIQGFAVALKAGATKAIFDQTLGIHPTSAEEFVTMREPSASWP